MPLPYAPPPKESKVYTDLKNLKITGVTADQLDTLKGELYAQGVDGSEDEMRRLKLLGEVSNQQSSSGPIPGSMQVISVTYDANQYYDIFTPSKGEVWKVVAAYIGTATGFTSGILAVLDVPNNIRIYVGDWGSGGGDLQDHGFITDLLIDENCTLQLYPYGTLSSASTVLTLLVRMR
jgi:hypothetical protein